MALAGAVTVSPERIKMKKSLDKSKKIIFFPMYFVVYWCLHLTIM